jgi:hypothetical protein
MMYKVVYRGEAVVAFGPNEDFFQPVVEAGDELRFTDVVPPPSTFLGYVAPEVGNGES